MKYYKIFWVITMENKRLELAFNDTKVYATLANNTQANDLIERLINVPITFSFKDFANSEKITFLNQKLIMKKDVTQKEEIFLSISLGITLPFFIKI